jgi:hypothetical protein
LRYTLSTILFFNGVVIRVLGQPTLNEIEMLKLPASSQLIFVTMDTLNIQSGILITYNNIGFSDIYEYSKPSMNKLRKRVIRRKRKQCNCYFNNDEIQQVNRYPELDSAHFSVSHNRNPGVYFYRVNKESSKMEFVANAYEYYLNPSASCFVLFIIKLMP